MKKVSMIMPCYNSAPYIDAMLDSIIAQTYDNIELIAAYDASTDDTLEKLRSWSSKFDSRGFTLKIVENAERLGITGGINKALPHFTGDYITFPDSDDYMFPEFCETMVGTLEANPFHNWVRCDNVMISDGEPERIMEYTNAYNKAFKPLGSPLCLMLYLIPRSPWRMVARAEFFRKVFPKSAIFQHPSSHEVPLALPLAFAEEPLHVAKPLYKYILHSSAYTISRHKSIHACIPYFDSMETVANDCIEQLEASYDFKKKLHDANRLYYLATKAYYSKNLRITILVERYTEMLLQAMHNFSNEIIIPNEFNPSLYWRQFYRYAANIVVGIYADKKDDQALWNLIDSNNFVLYGAGKNCDEILPILQDLNKIPKKIWDKNANEIISKNGIDVINPLDEISENTTIAITILSRKFSAVVEKNLYERGCKKLLDVNQLNRALRYGMMQKYFPNMIVP